jgi:hypothetical protein
MAGSDTNTIAAEALKLAMTTVSNSNPVVFPAVFCPTTIAACSAGIAEQAERFVVALSLAEAETLRRLVHLKHTVLGQAAVALHTVDGRLVDKSDNYWPAPATAPGTAKLTEQSLLCMRFFNCEMYFQRDRHLWGDTPLARLFAPQEEWRLLPARAVVEQARVAIKRAIASRGVDPYDVFARLDADHDGAVTYEQVQRLFEWLRLGFSPGDCYEVARMADPQGSGLVTLAQLQNVLALATPDTVSAQLRELELKRQVRQALKGATVGRWQCRNCSYINVPTDTTCAICEYGWTGQRECPRDKWVCASEKGGCTFFNPKSNFYCEMCNRSRPDLANIRLL